MTVRPLARKHCLIIHIVTQPSADSLQQLAMNSITEFIFNDHSQFEVQQSSSLLSTLNTHITPPFHYPPSAG